MAQFSDNFNRANNVSLGSNWTEYAPGGGDGIQISANECYLRPGATYAGFAFVATATYTAAANCSAEAKFVPASTNVNASGIGVRLSTDGTKLTGYGVEVSQTELHLFSYTAWALSYLAGSPSRVEIGSSTGLTIADGDTIKVEAIGSTIKVYHNSSEKISVTDTDHSSGQPGVFSSSVTGTFGYVDDFIGADILPDGGGSPLGLGFYGGWNCNMGHP